MSCGLAVYWCLPSQRFVLAAGAGPSGPAAPVMTGSDDDVLRPGPLDGGVTEANKEVNALFQ